MRGNDLQVWATAQTGQAVRSIFLSAVNCGLLAFRHVVSFPVTASDKPGDVFIRYQPDDVKEQLDFDTKLEKAPLLSIVVAAPDITIPAEAAEELIPCPNGIKLFKINLPEKIAKWVMPVGPVIFALLTSVS